MFDSVLVANRGEIAVRIIRTLAALGLRSVAVYSDADADAPHVRAADTALRLGPESPARSYLSIERVLDAALRSGAQAIHPGYGFLSESAPFARACADTGIVFVGPPADAIAAMGDKIRAKALAEAAGVPVVPGVHRPGMDDAALAEAADALGYPLLVKAAAGGGGRGMRVVEEPAALRDALAAARREALGAFGDDTLFLERFLPTPRHVEVQVFADTHGSIVHLGERECSLQRRHQKIVEESPSPFLDDDARQRLATSAVAVAKACGYVGAGTVEYLLSEQDAAEEAGFSFLEVNPRLQVEHTVTEEVFGIDLVEWQLRVAAGERLPLSQSQVQRRGHAIQARVYAEDPARDFLPTGGTVVRALLPAGDGIRVDSGIAPGAVVGGAYDPLLAKVTATGADRDRALQRLRRALDTTAVLGVRTNTTFLRALLDQPEVREGRLDTGLVTRHVEQLTRAQAPDVVLAAVGLGRLARLQPPAAAADPFDLPGGWRLGEAAWARWRVRAGARSAAVAVRGTPAAAEVRIADGPTIHARVEAEPGRLRVWLAGEHSGFVTADADGTVWLAAPGIGVWACEDEDELAAARGGPRAPAAGHVAPMPGTVTAVHVAAGDLVRQGQTLLVVDAMKMEHAVRAAAAGTVGRVDVRAGERVRLGQVLVVLEEGG